MAFEIDLGVCRTLLESNRKAVWKVSFGLLQLSALAQRISLGNRVADWLAKSEKVKRFDVVDWDSNTLKCLAKRVSYCGFSSL